MLAYVSLWSADLLDLRAAVRAVDADVAGYHLDVFDGHHVAELLFGPDLVGALRRTTARPLEVHLNVVDPLPWVERFADAGADIISVQTRECRDVDEVLTRIAERGCRPSLGLELHEPVEHALAHLGVVDRVLLMGTRVGVKGQELHPATPGRVAALAAARSAPGRTFEIVVDGGIRRHTVPGLAEAGADGVVPGSLVFGHPDPAGAVRQVSALRSGSPVGTLDGFWTTDPTSPSSRPLGREGGRR